jgi:hypothetical protein
MSDPKSSSRKIVVELQDDFVVLDVEYPYEIALDRIPNHAALVEWISHLCAKKWVDSHVIRSFIYVVSEAKGWEVYGNHD